MLNELTSYKSEIINQTSKSWHAPILSSESVSILPTSWFNMDLYKSDNKCFIKDISEHVITNKNFMIKLKLILSMEQEKILNLWFKLFCKMHNKTLDIIHQNKDHITYENRWNYLSDFKNEIINESKLSGPAILSEILNNAVNLSFSYYQKLEKDYEAGYVKSIKIKKWKQKPTNGKLFCIGKCFINSCEKIIHSNIFGKITYIDTACTIQNVINHEIPNCKIKYLNKEYYMVASVTEKNMIVEEKNKVISIDPGLNPFLVVLTDNSVIKICSNLAPIIYKKIMVLKQMLENKKSTQAIEKRKIMIFKKINNLVQDMHNKVIKYLTDNYDIIIVGDFGMNWKCRHPHNIPNTFDTQLSELLKYFLNYDEFIFKLKNKCHQKNLIYKEIDESYTSKACSNCGNYNINLGRAKVYVCNKCGINIDRNINACRGIFIKSQINDTN